MESRNLIPRLEALPGVNDSSFLVSNKASLMSPAVPSYKIPPLLIFNILYVCPLVKILV